MLDLISIARTGKISKVKEEVLKSSSAKKLDAEEEG